MPTRCLPCSSRPAPPWSRRNRDLGLVGVNAAFGHRLAERRWLGAARDKIMIDSGLRSFARCTKAEKSGFADWEAHRAGDLAAAGDEPACEGALEIVAGPSRSPWCRTSRCPPLAVQSPKVWATCGRVTELRTEGGDLVMTTEVAAFMMTMNSSLRRRHRRRPARSASAGSPRECRPCRERSALAPKVWRHRRRPARPRE